MSTSNTIYNSFKTWAKILYEEDGVKYSEPGPEVIDIMATRYCEALDAGDERAKNKYIAGLMLRFWNAVGKMYMKSPNIQLEYDDITMWLYEAIEYACKYRAWLDPEKPNVKHAQQAINQCIETIRLQHYYDLNLDKHRANYNAVSMDMDLNDGTQGEGKTTFGDTLVDFNDLDDVAESEADYNVRTWIQSYINKKKIVEAIILDTIAFNDVYKVTRKVVQRPNSEGENVKHTEVYKEFWPFRCVQVLSTLPVDYEKYFMKKYNFNSEEFEAALGVIRGATNQKLYKFLSKTLEDAKSLATY